MNDSAVFWEFDQQICSEPEEADLLVRVVIKRLKRYEWLEQDVFGVHMALAEALSNAIKHGNANDCDKQIRIRIQIREDCFYAKIADEGQGFDPENVPDPREESNLEKTSGRGVTLIRNFVDFVKYNAAGNTVEIKKNKTME